MHARWQFWIDRGGTFTDVVARAPDGAIRVHKLLSENPEQYPDAALQGMRDLLGLGKDESLPDDIVDAVKMGTTVATNALLERKGTPTVLAITRGLGDALRIGYQNRPDIFARRIVLPEQLYARTVEVEERLRADGTVERPLDRGKTRADLEAAHAEGFRAVAIVLMHGYRHHEHELAVAEIAREIGFTQVSVSHEVSPLMKLVGRGDTAVVDAYLSPILRAYVDRVAGEAGDVRLMFMQSNGGLVDARLFQGKDAILSGPAGGVVGAAKTAALAGFDRIVGFDMGGTSTDVTHYAGAFERAFDTEVAGVRIRAPMMKIHTVAAGGGSIISFDGQRFRVGPESAGANPGPACYRRGGPLAVTDANLMVGKLLPEFFPRVFGPGADQPLDAEVVRAAFAALAQEVHKATGIERSPEELAQGCLAIANDNMANAIKEISIQRGIDVTKGYTLCCFGGAGAQHACHVADLLGIARVHIHPLASVLSAYGMGLADIRVLRQRTVERPLDVAAVEELEMAAAALREETIGELRAQDVPEERIATETRVHVRYAGTDTSLEVPLAGAEELRAAFEAEHRSRYGFVVEGRGLVVEAVTVEGIGATEEIPASEAPASPREPTTPLEPILRTPVYTNRAPHQPAERLEAAVHTREALRPGDSVTGPALICGATTTVVVEPGWALEVTGRDDLVLHRVEPLARQADVGTRCDPILLEIFNNLFMTIAEQMGVTLQSTAYSVNVKERLDFSCAVFDAEGALVANAPHMPVHLGSMGQSVRTILELNRDRLKPGDVWALNNPYNGGTHLPDITVVMPVFEAGELVFFTASRAHHADVGGITPGSMPPDSTHIDEEGVLFDNFLLVEDGRLREAALLELLRSGPWPVRNETQNVADLQAQVASCQRGANELAKMVHQFGLATCRAYMGHVQD
ncbi:MAG TPA: hydantoinase/oxoprolinase family protein, partial [Geminicoccaceae bacterium]|nr:hydantoinase/oxoprolinase family protein [Geminicoccaceae bacterium]